MGSQSAAPDAAPDVQVNTGDDAEVEVTPAAEPEAPAEAPEAGEPTTEDAPSE